MKIYHGATSPNGLDEARAIAPDWEHGYCWIPKKMTPHDAPYILDNGAYGAYTRGEPWDVDAFVKRLNQIPDMPREPDFVVLPDVVADSDSTDKRAEIWSEQIDYRTAFPVQDGHSPTSALNHAEDIGAEVIFVGGTVEWKRRNAEDFVDECRDRGLDVHIARPGNINWIKDVQPDSVDTSSYARGAWDRFAEEIGQTTLLQSANGET